MKTALLLPTLVMGFAAAGCLHTGFSNTSGMVVPARSPNCDLDVVFQEPPSRPYLVLGLVTTNSTAPALFAIGENNIVAMRRVIERACTVGAHGLMNVVLDSHPVRVGKGHWKSTTGSALAFVYLDAFGRPLPPPNGQRLAIQPGAYPSPVVPATPPPAVAAPPLGSAVN